MRIEVARRTVMGRGGRLRSLFLAAIFGAQASLGAIAADPKVPPGVDPGGTGVAIIGEGIDYRRPDLAPRLARDGEGELIGWDFVDEDRLPFAASGMEDAVASLIVNGSPARLVPMRVARGDGRQVMDALRMLGDMRVQVVLLAAGPEVPVERSKLSAALRPLASLLIVVPARFVTAEAGKGSAVSDGTGLLTVTSASSRAADVLVLPPANGVAREAFNDDLAAAQIAALAARLVARDPSLAGAGLRERVLGFTAADASGRKVLSGIDGVP